MILGKKDKDYVKGLEEALISLNEKVDNLNDKLTAQVQRINAKEQTIMLLSSSVYILKDLEYLHKDLEISYTDIASRMQISVSTLTKYRKGTLELTPVRYKELMTNLIKSYMKDTQ